MAILQRITVLLISFIFFCLGDALKIITAGGETKRRDVLNRFVASSTAAVGIITGIKNHDNVANAAAGGLVFYSSNSGGKQFQYADAKIGEGEPKKIGDSVMINYIMSSTGLSNGVKIYSTTDAGQSPYEWIIGDKSTIPGLEQAIIGGDGVPPMLPGGIRRVIIQGGSAGGGYDTKDCGPGPIPRGETYNRFKNVFCNPTRPDTPELVLDIKLLTTTT